ncbi:hypothetical protein MKW92_038390 [Papaver armeniacum]|nr:hypothetical protein MKW92_038390 [Papaver armeniacum]
MTVIAPEPVIVENNNPDHKEEIKKEEEVTKEEQQDLKLDGGFEVPKNNAFGHSFRDYDKESERKASVEEFYKTNHINQTYEFAIKKEYYEKLDKTEMSIWECCELLNEFVDESDPDLDEPQIEHLLQTAEYFKENPDNDDPRYDQCFEVWVRIKFICKFAKLSNDQVLLNCGVDLLPLLTLERNLEIFG